MKVEEVIKKIKELMKKPESIRNIGTVAHIDHGKTTLSDSLIAGAGFMSPELAGRQLYLDYLEEERKRGITIQTGAVSMVHDYKGKTYLINLLDTPGHIDFSGDVTRSLRSLDGVILVVCAVEGVMPQTETVIRQSMKEKVKPILFINKVDRLIKELKLEPKDIEKRFEKVIREVNRLIRKYAPAEFKEQWQVSVKEGSVAFGSALQKWAISYPLMKETGITFDQIINYLKEEKIKELEKKSPSHRVILDMVIRHLPNPIQAQQYRIPRIWRGELESEVGKDLKNCNSKGKMVMCIHKMITDPHAGPVALGRVFSGSIKKGQEVLIDNRVKEKAQQICIYLGPRRVPVEEVPAGNIVAIVGLKKAASGDTISLDPVEPFERIKHLFEPVVTKAIEAKHTKDLTRLIKALREKSKEDPTIHVEIDPETGEHLISGLGELHLEILENWLERDRGIEVETSPPIVVYRETVAKESLEVMGKSPNKHNQLFFKVEPLEEKCYQAMVEGEIEEGRVRKKHKKLIETLQEKGMPGEEARNTIFIKNHSVLINMTRGVQALREIIELVINGFKEVVEEGPLAREKVTKVKVKLLDAKLHVDAIHRGPAQIIPATRSAIKEAILHADAFILEPVQKLRIDCPNRFMGAVISEVQSRRGKILKIEQKETGTAVIVKLPVAESFGFTSALRSATEGRAIHSLIDSKFEPLPPKLQEKVIRRIRKRKGLKLEAEIS